MDALPKAYLVLVETNVDYVPCHWPVAVHLSEASATAHVARLEKVKPKPAHEYDQREYSIEEIDLFG
jgi:hypothetical protein